MLFVILHDNQAPYAKSMFAAQLHGPPFNLHAHGARVIVDLGDVGQDGRVDFGAHGFGQVFGERWVGYLSRESAFYAEGGAFVEF
jgi:hypothetical protein